MLTLFCLFLYCTLILGAKLQKKSETTIFFSNYFKIILRKTHCIASCKSQIAKGVCVADKYNIMITYKYYNNNIML